MREWDDSVLATLDPAPSEPDPPGARRSLLALEDGTIVGSISNSFEEQPGGFTARLSVSLPATCGQHVIDHHLEHFAVEFRNWILGAAAEQAAAVPTQNRPIAEAAGGTDGTSRIRPLPGLD